MAKIKVLFIVGGLHRAGAERFAYEIDKALNKEKFKTSIFCLERCKDIPINFGERYYESKHLKLGTEIIYSDDFIDSKYFERNRYKNKILQRLHLFPKKIEYWKKELYDFINQFDVIHWMGEYTFIHTVSEQIRKKSLIHMMSSRFQNDNLYKDFNYDLFYRFCTPFKENEISYELENFKNYETIFIPLILDLSNSENRWQFKNNTTKKIGIFTRLNIYKPLDPFFYAYQLLLDQYPNCELHIFGAGNPETEGMYRYLDRLGIRDKVFFKGHQEDIVKTAIEEELALSWFQGYNNDRPAGYAGIDICTTGTPLICWDFHHAPINPFNKVYPHYKNLNKFVAITIEILTNQEKAEELSILQFEDTKKTRNIDDYISTLEQEYIRIFKLNNE